MSTPQTLTQALPPHQYFDHRQRYLPSPQDRYLPPPRPSSNVSGFHGSIPTRPPSNVQLHQLPPPSRTHSGMSNRYSQGQARGGAEYGYTNGYTPQLSAQDPGWASAASGRYQHPLHHEEKMHESRAPAIPSRQLPPTQDTAEAPSSSADRKRRRGKEGPDWEQFYSKGVPKEVILIHEGDTPPPPKATQHAPPPPTTGASTTQHVEKRRRVNGGGAEAPIYSATNTPYSHSNGTSTDSLQATTAPTSLGSNASSSSRLEGAQAGQKRKRTTRTSEIERKKQETERAGPRGYLAEYGEYIPPPKQYKKQKEVHVPVLTDVRRGTRNDWGGFRLTISILQRSKSSDKIDDEDGHYIIQENSRLGEKYSLMNLLGQGTFGKVVKAIDLRTRKEVAVKVIRAVPKVRSPQYLFVYSLY